MSNAMDDLYDVTNGVNTVNAADHNTLVAASQFQYDGFGGIFNFGNGQDGHLFLGSIATTTTTAPTMSLNGSGNLTGTFYYKYSAYNLSGETAASTASATIAPSGQKVSVAIPGVGSATNVTGFYVYRSADNITYYRVGFVAVDDPTAGATFVDNFPITSGTAPSGSNTTSASATAEGIYFARTLTMTTGQTLTQTTGSSIGLVIICQGNVVFNSGATINASGKGLATVSPVTKASGVGTSGTTSSGGGGLFPSAGNCSVDLLRNYNKTGIGAGGSPGAIGGSVLIISQTQIIAQGTVTATATNSSNGTLGSGGSGGGNIIFIAPYVNRNGGTFTANGGNAGNASGSDAGAGGGGGGLVSFIANHLVGTATSTVNGGTGGTSTGSGAGSGEGGGAGAGNGGNAGGSLGTTGSNGSAGLVHTGTLRNTLMRF